MAAAFYVCNLLIIKLAKLFYTCFVAIYSFLTNFGTYFVALSVEMIFSDRETTDVCRQGQNDIGFKKRKLVGGIVSLPICLQI